MHQPLVKFIFNRSLLNLVALATEFQIMLRVQFSSGSTPERRMPVTPVDIDSCHDASIFFVFMTYFGALLGGRR